MNRFLSSSRRHAGFTLVELLVVIGIIAILAGVVLGGAAGALKSAQRTKTLTTATNIQNAMLNYYTEYMVYPAPVGVAKDTYYDNTNAGQDGTDWKLLLGTLSGNKDLLNPASTIPTGYMDAGGNPINSRGIAYVSFNRSDVDKVTGIVKTAAAPSSVSQYFFMAVDTDYDGVLGGANSSVKLTDFTNPPNVTVSQGNLAINAGVAVWSNCAEKPVTSATGSNLWIHTY